MKRLFIAIKIVPQPILLNIYKDIKQHCSASKIKWVDESLFHLTLKFLGNTYEERIKTIVDVMIKTGENIQPFVFNLKGVGMFGSQYQPRVIWFGIENNTQLTLLGQYLIEQLHKAGFPHDRQNFVPHLTVGRIKYIQNKQRFQKILSKYQRQTLQKVTVNQIILYESLLKPTGPVYSIIEKINLKPL